MRADLLFDNPFKRPSMLSVADRKPDEAPKTFAKLGDLTFGVTVIFRGSPHMVVEVSAYHSLLLQDHLEPYKKLKNALFVLNLLTGRVYSVKKSEKRMQVEIVHVNAHIEQGKRKRK